MMSRVQRPNRKVRFTAAVFDSAREIMEGAVATNQQIAWCVVGQKQLCVTINVLRAISDQVRQMMGFET